MQVRQRNQRTYAGGFRVRQISIIRTGKCTEPLYLLGFGAFQAVWTARPARQPPVAPRHPPRVPHVRVRAPFRGRGHDRNLCRNRYTNTPPTVTFGRRGHRGKCCRILPTAFLSAVVRGNSVVGVPAGTWVAGDLQTSRNFIHFRPESLFTSLRNRYSEFPGIPIYIGRILHSGNSC